MFTLKINAFTKLQLITWLYLLFFVIYSNAIFKQFWYLKLVLLVAICLSFFIKFFDKQIVVLLLGIVALQSIITFWFKYYLDGNHCFVLIFVGLLLILAHLFQDESELIFKKNVTWMLFIIMFFGAFQKLISPTYMSGDFMNFMFTNGDLFKVTQIYKPLNDYYLSNLEQLKTFAMAQPVADEVLKVPYFFKNQQQFFYYFGWFVVLMEFLFLPFLFIKNQKIKHTFFIIFLFSLLLTRQETGFLSLVCLLCFSLLPQNFNKYLHLLYLFFFFTCMMLIYLGKGFY